MNSSYNNSFMMSSARIRKIVGILNRTYGRPAPLVPTDPVDELIRTVLSQNTNDRNSLAAFAALKKRFHSWESLLKTNAKSVAHLIKRAGLANIKARRIKEILSEIRRREGRISLNSLNGLDVPEASLYLRSFRGVGPKTTACVLLFSFNKPAMPVDTHIFRVAKRLALIKSGLNIEEAHEVLTRLIPRHLIYNFHLGIIEHGRRTCRAQTPKCGICALYSLCHFKHKGYYKKIGAK